MAHAQCIDKALERDLTPRPDRAEQVADRQFAEAFFLFELDLRIARLEREDVGRLLHPAALEKKLDLLLAQPLDVEGAPGDEMFQILAFLERACELAGATRNGALLAARGRLAHHRSMQGTWAAGGKFVRFRRSRPLLDNNTEHLRDDVAGALDGHRVVFAHIKAF